ncbi:hypothetical protein [Acidovorax sp. SUPP2825]|uniref:hypothetical protein n=1 Tax=Acidovorax sp. SUPP2825 TaxID=2920879 RepID=UPI0023DE613D|nr:hypothetical protein [Acidovorax sp. SUPP2825]GKS96291.1 hypothetical protein AVAK2825_17170 [Acidovorax sp. SUPP2825]
MPDSATPLRCRVRWPAMGVAAGLACVLSGCALTGTAGYPPSASRVLAVPADLPTPRLFDCAAASLARMSEASSAWPGITRRDDAQGLLESGHFPEWNRSGFRMRIERPPGGGEATLTLKAGGAYLADLGAAQAMNDFEAVLRPCIGAAGGGRTQG